MTALLEVEGLRVRLPTPTGFATVVDGVDYHVEQAQVFGVAGESGSGKTMSMLALLGLLPPGSRGARRSAERICSACAAVTCAPSPGATSGWSSRIP